MKENTEEKTLSSQNTETTTKEENPITLEDMVKDPKYKEQALLVANSYLGLFGNRWVNFKRFSREMKKSNMEGKTISEELKGEFLNICQYLKAFDLAVTKVDRGDLKLKIDLNHDSELELIEIDLNAINIKKKELENRKKYLLDLKKETEAKS